MPRVLSPVVKAAQRQRGVFQLSPAKHGNVAAEISSTDVMRQAKLEFDVA